jgi:hypothetical protein
MRVAFVVLLLSIPLAAPARALDVTFSGTVANTCILSLSTPGLMALSLDGLTLGSDQVGGVPATVSIVSVGTNTITVDPPARTAAPAGYSASGESVEVSYSGVGGLSVVNQAYTSATSSFDVGLLAATELLVNNRIINPAGFAQGNYTTRTVVTCS